MFVLLEIEAQLHDWERDELISNLVGALSSCRKEIQDKMIEIYRNCDEDYEKRVAERLKAAGTEANTKMEVAENLADQLGQPSDPY